MILDDIEGISDRDELRAVVTDLLHTHAPTSGAVARAEAVMAGAGDRDLWRRLGQEIGVAGLAVPERWGGGGATFAEVAVVLGACARNLATVPLRGSWLAAEAILRSGDRVAADRWLPGLASGQTIPAVTLESHDLVATRHEGGVRITGLVGGVVHGMDADLLVVPVEIAGEVAVAVVEVDDVERKQVESLDLTVPVASIRLDETSGTLLGGDSALSLVEVVRDLAAVAVSCEQVAVAEQALADAVSYACERVQFDRVIGSFQAVKHLLADVATAVDLAQSLVDHAVWAVCESPESLRTAASMAIVQSSRAARFATAENVQVHGGIGFSWEHHAHLYFRMARSNAVILGGGADFCERLLAELDVPPGPVRG